MALVPCATEDCDSRIDPKHVPGGLCRKCFYERRHAKHRGHPIRRRQSAMERLEARSYTRPESLEETREGHPARNDSGPVVLMPLGRCNASPAAG
jgi:hypothetical protein